MRDGNDAHVPNLQQVAFDPPSLSKYFLPDSNSILTRPSSLAVARFAEPLAYTSVNPYLPAMVRSFGVPQNKVAKWAGLTSSVFSLAQSITAVGWGKAADKYGRKPILISGLLCTMICFIIWGMSTSLPMAITIRAIQGGSNGNGTSHLNLTDSS